MVVLVGVHVQVRLVKTNSLPSVGRVACSRVLAATVREGGFSQPFSMCSGIVYIPGTCVVHVAMVCGTRRTGPSGIKEVQTYLGTPQYS